MISPIKDSSYYYSNYNNAVVYSRMAAQACAPEFVNPREDVYSLELSEKSLNKIKKTDSVKECETCRNRKYVDESDDSSVSFQTPTSISPQASKGAVLAHEQEHVRNEQADAKSKGREVLYQSVSVQYAICPECGVSYVAGGLTKTVTAAKKENDAQRQAEGGIDFTA